VKYSPGMLVGSPPGHAGQVPPVRGRLPGGWFADAMTGKIGLGLLPQEDAQGECAERKLVQCQLNGFFASGWRDACR
jgi:hypothetical protein